ncbi:PucR family transcriptional regulator [Corynebacterium sp. AOP40-9SA-29]|uniref:PucR family transcriptional regulator n=1 Tax=Corynebacterium sp. AOP40-9SA-29 TaxID=3457677 RepID=UPI0040343817
MGDLVSLAAPGLRYRAGEVGAQRLVTWAHVCDLEDPWNWIARGDLMMTTGPGVPRAPQDQAWWLGRLIDAGASALVVAPKEGSLELGSEMLELADERSFPVLDAEFGLHFVALARAVIESTVDAERARVAAIKRLYEINGRAIEEGHDLDERLSALEKVSGWNLRIWDDADATVLFTGRGARRAGLDGAPGTGEGEDAEQTVALYGDPDIRLVARARPAREGDTGDGALLAHVVGLLGMEFRYRAAGRDQLRASGEGLLSGLVDESITVAAVWPELRRRGMIDGVAVVCWYTGSDTPLDHHDLHRREWLRGTAPLLMPLGGQLLGLVPADGVVAERASALLGDTVVAGVSSPLTANSSFPELVRQARLAASRAMESGQVCVRYGSAWDDSDLFPASVEGVRGLVRRVLGPLIDYDRDHGTDLVNSVWVLLDHDGNWSRSAEELHVHRQTLVYRMNKVAELCSVRPTSTKGAALMWFAFESARRAGLDVAAVRDIEGSAGPL